MPAQQEPPPALPGAQASLPAAGGVTRLDGLPLEIISGPGPEMSVEVRPLDPTQAAALSPFGLAFRLTVTSETGGPLSPASLTQPLQLTIDYSAIPLAYGGSAAERLILLRLSGCHDEAGTPVCASRETLAV